MDEDFAGGASWRVSSLENTHSATRIDMVCELH